MAEAVSEQESARESTRDIGQRIRTILRRDLKLGQDIELDEETPFFSEQTDLDSLDMLLLVSAIEKEFQIKVPSEEVGQQAFQNVKTLTAFIREKIANPMPNVASTMPQADSVQWLSRLPHAEPFRFVSQLLDLQPGVSGRGVWSLRGDEPFFAGHFPGRPIVPGVLIGEALAQLSGLVGATDESSIASLAQLDVRFERLVVPPADMTLYSKLTTQLDALQQFEVLAELSGQSVARGTLTLNRQVQP